MAIYEYKCVCGLVFDLARPMNDSDKKGKCPNCDKMANRQFSSSIGIVIN